MHAKYNLYKTKTNINEGIWMGWKRFPRYEVADVLYSCFLYDGYSIIVTVDI